MDHDPDPCRWLMPQRRVPAALIMTLLMQAAGALIWATHLEARVGQVERQSVSAALLQEKFARLEERLDALKDTLEDLRRHLLRD